MSYTSKYTGEEIDELLDKVNEGGGSVSVLFDGNAPDMNVSYTLSDSIDNYDMIAVLFSWNDGLNAKGSYVGTPEIAKTGTIEYSIYRPNNVKASWYIRMTFNSSTTFIITNQEYDATYFGSAKPAIRGVYGIKLGTDSDGKNEDAPNLNISEDYSMEEKRIGIWIDGKPLYQKAIVIDSVGKISTTAKSFAHNIQNAEIVWITDGFLFNTNNKSFALDGGSRYFTSDRTNIYVTETSGSEDFTQLQAYVILRYTKTTD